MTEHTTEIDAYDDEGFVLDEYGQPFGYCNACGEEAPAYAECCESGKVVPYARSARIRPGGDLVIEIETDPKTLPQWKGRPVPWITRWTGQVYDTTQAQNIPSLVRGEDGRQGLSYRDPMEIRDDHGVLWLREGLVRSGDPIWKAVSTNRQREAMKRRLCQVCGVKISLHTEGIATPWLVDEPEWDSLRTNVEKGQPALTVMAPVCPPCIGLATRLCPALLRGFRLLRVDLYKPWGVMGDSILNGQLRGRQMVSYAEHLRLPFTVARQMFVELEAFDEIGDWT